MGSAEKGEENGVVYFFLFFALFISLARNVVFFRYRFSILDFQFAHVHVAPTLPRSLDCLRLGSCVLAFFCLFAFRSFLHHSLRISRVISLLHSSFSFIVLSCLA